MTEGTKATRVQNYQYHVTHGKNRILSDVPEALGGQDLGLKPHALIEAALAVCTSMTMQMYADRKQWPLEKADVTVVAIQEGHTTTFTRTIKLYGALDAEQHERLLDIANKCPIHKMLTGSITVKTEEA